MKIVKILNNNIALALDEKGEDIVVIGRGITFGKKCGDSIDEHQVTRVFVQSPEDEQRILDFVKQVPAEYIDASMRVVESAKFKLGREFEGNLYFTLADHLQYTVERARQGLLMQNRLLLEIKLAYGEEFEAGLMATKYLSKLFDVDLPEDEAAFIAMHFVNATLGVSMSETYAIAEVVKDIYSIIRKWLTSTFEEGSLSWYRLMVHIKFFAQRMVMGSSELDGLQDEWLFEMTKSRYPHSFECAARIAEFLKLKYDYSVPNAELAYLAIHIERVNHGMHSSRENDETKRGDVSHGDER